MKFRIKDRVILGAFSGALSTTLLNFLDFLSIILHTNEWHIWQIAGSLFFTQEELKTIIALVLGGITHTTLTSCVGVVICYILFFTGRSLYIIKGIGVFLLFWIILFGGTLRLGITSISQPLGVPTNFAHFTGHLLDGILTSFFIIKFGDKKVWKKPIPTLMKVE